MSSQFLPNQGKSKSHRQCLIHPNQGKSKSHLPAKPSIFQFQVLASFWRLLLISTPSTHHFRPLPLPRPDPEKTLKHALDILNLIATELEHVRKASKDLVDYGKGVTDQIEEASAALGNLNKLVKGESENQSQSRPEDLDDADLQELLDLKKKVLKLKLQIPSKYKPETPQTVTVSDSDQNRNHQQRSDESVHGNRGKASKKQGKVPNLSKGLKFEESLAFRDFHELYDTLGDAQKLCLLSFSVFPEHEVIKKRFMLYWWIGEGFVGTPEKKAEQVAGERNDQREIPEEQLPNEWSEKLEPTAEDSANEVFNELLAKGFLEPFSEKRTLIGLVNKCKMHPFVRAAVVILARKAKFFDFDSEGKLTNSFSSSYRACLLADKNLSEKEDLNNLHMLFNVDQTILEFQKPERFSMMKNINIFCLGRWQISPRHHIEVEDTNFLEGFKNMKHLKFLSLQGISRIMELPTSISKLVNLTILDLKACPNLEEIPKEIGLLKCLTHLDMSECYLLVNMPKEISTLVELQVLKGFVVGTLNLKGKNTCTLEQLANLPKLRKLSIYTGRKDFPATPELKILSKCKVLRKLTIEWGGDSQGKLDNDSNREEVAEKPMEAEAKQPENEGEGQSTGEKSIPTEAPQPENASEGNSMPAEATQPGNEGEGKSIDTEGIVPENGTEGKSTTEVSKQENHEDANTKNQVNAEDSTATPATTNRCNCFTLATKKD
ncbi:uncharacterized protein LOC130774418 [Actinidia eriantha]|uniref:uncharacterized protein LOC130774418 n=1 Tax=Actinidia eriantha TaxID=165200 RepID=UPI00258D1CA3|nr:uncharacterized protein LOC130774418 [Actinidia eriantha]